MSADKAKAQTAPYQLEITPDLVVIFDMDGVIVDSELHWKELEGFFLQGLVPGWKAEDQSRIIGLSLENLYTMLHDEYGMTEPRESFMEQYHRMAHRIYREQANLLPGFSDTLDCLLEAGVPLALASSSPRSWIDITLERFKLGEAFQVVLSAGEIGGKGKPAPDIYLHTAERMGVNPAQCTVIEDSKNGALSAQAAGMFCIGIRNGFNDEQDLSAADVIIDGFSGLRIGDCGLRIER